MTSRAATCLASLLLLSALTAAPARAQNLNVYATGIALGGADLEFDLLGNLYATGGAGGGGKLYKVAPGGGAATILTATGLFYPWGLAVGPTGTIYVCDRGDQSLANQTKIYSVNATTGALTLFKSGLPHCAFITCDGSGNLYGAVYSGNKVIKITPGGVVSDYATGLGTLGDQLYQMSFDLAGNLYVGVEAGMYKVGPGGSPVTPIFTTGASQSMGHIRWGSDNFIVANYGFHQLVHYSSALGFHNLLTPAGCTTTGVLADGVNPGTASMFHPSGMRLRSGMVFVGDYDCHDVRSFDLPGILPVRGASWGRVKTLYR